MFKHYNTQVRGRGHEKSGTSCQDYTYFNSAKGVQVITLADGAGTAEFSEYGAQTVAKKACGYLVQNFHRLYNSEDGVSVKKELHDYLLSEIETRRTKLSEKADCTIKDLASTFLMVAVHQNEFILAHIGDGVIGYIRNGELKVASAPDNDEFANTTTFVTSSNALSAMRMSKGSLDGVAGFILMSDGTENSLYNKKAGTLSGACIKLIETVAKAPTYTRKNPRYEREIKRVLRAKIKENTNDDCSVAILGRLL